MKRKLEKLTGLRIYGGSLADTHAGKVFLGRGDNEKLVGCISADCLPNTRKVGELEGLPVCVGPCNHANAARLRELLPWTAPALVGLATSIGLGDRLGLATPGHIRAVRGTGLRPIFAQQSIREMTRTRRSPEEVLDCATYGVLQEGFGKAGGDGFGADADHLQRLEDIDSTAAAGFTLFTIDPGQHVVNEADALGAVAALARAEAFDYASLETRMADLWAAYAGRPLLLRGEGAIFLTGPDLARAIAKYGQAIAHTVRMYRHLLGVMQGRAFELEVSVDETETPTTPGEHYFFASELKRLGVRWVSMAPRFIGRFEKGVDYLGDLKAFRRSFAEHVAVMRTVGPYKMSIHSGSDKFSIYPIVAELTEGLVHLKTAGTSYLEALRAIARTDPGLFREIYEFARQHYETDKKSYHVSANMAKVPPARRLTDAQLAGRLDDFHARQALHVTFGSVLTADGGERFRGRLYAALERDEEAHYAALARHLGRHIAPFVGR